MADASCRTRWAVSYVPNRHFLFEQNKEQVACPALQKGCGRCRAVLEGKLRFHIPKFPAS